MKEYRIDYNSRAIEIMDKIIENEDLSVAVESKESALGDDVVVIFGAKEEVEIFKQIFEMVY